MKVKDDSQGLSSEVETVKLQAKGGNYSNRVQEQFFPKRVSNFE